MADALLRLGWDEFRQEGLSEVYVARVPQHSLRLHDHVFHEIVYIDSGTGEHVSAEGRRRIVPGDLIVIRPQVWHGYDRTRNLTIVNCLFTKRMLQRFAPLLEEVEGSFELFRRPARRPEHEAPAVLHARPAQRPALVERLERIMSEQRTRANGWQAAISAALLDILVMTARLHRQQLTTISAPAKAPGRTDQAVLDTVTHLESSYAQTIRLDELASRVNFSPAHLSRHFSRQMGMGVVEFAHRLRCEEACRLLRWSDEPVGRIATRVGYDEIAYFSRCFRRQIGQSPRQYRRESRGLDPVDASRVALPPRV
jgi:AraC family L-rhamnose operon transcriptional activator RhaR